MKHWTPAELRRIYNLWPCDYGVMQYALLMYHNHCMARYMLWLIETGRIQVIQVAPVQSEFRGKWN